MRTVRRMKEFRREQQRLARREVELRELIHADWIEIKDAARPKNILRGFQQKTRPQPSSKSSWVELISKRAESFVDKVAQQAQSKIEAKVNQKLESVLSKFSAKRS